MIKLDGGGQPTGPGGEPMAAAARGGQPSPAAALSGSGRSKVQMSDFTEYT